MTKKWDYAYWQKRFREARDEDLCDLHKEILEKAGYKVHPLKVWDAKNKAPITPKLKHNKDEVIKKLILSKNHGNSVLIVGFLDTRFAFNLGLGEGFTVDGIDVNDDCVNVANTSLKTLPNELASKFNFYHMLAEDLSNLPQYDFSMNFCLEHLRDPKQAIEENLKHLKRDGYAYFTPPIRHGTDAPTHLHYFFDESDLMKLLPSGYTTNIYRVKFNVKSPRDNCFIMEVYRKHGEDKETSL